MALVGLLGKGDAPDLLELLFCISVKTCAIGLLSGVNWARSMSEGASWLREPIEELYEGRFLRFERAVREWWRETTDVVFLNSPWLKRSTGRALRCVWICIHLARWLIFFLFGEALQEATRSLYRQLELVLMVCCFARVLWVAIMTEKDSIWSGLLMCVGLLVSFHSWSRIAYDTGLSYEDLGFAMLPLLHCNVHPLGMWCILGLGLALYVHDFSYAPSPFANGLALHSLTSLSFIVCAWTIDFSNRIKAVSSGMLYGRLSDSIASAALQSPVAGRSGRIPCWLAGWNNWIWWLVYMKATTEDNEQLVRASVLLFFLVLVFGAYASNKLLGWRADIALGLLCHMPPMLVFIEVNSAPKEWNAAVVGYVLAHTPAMYVTHTCENILLFGTQTLIQAGGHPVVCAAFTPLVYFVVVFKCMEFSIGEYYIFHLLTGPMMCLVLICSHFVDYFARMKAIQEGFLSSEGNARSAENVTTSLEWLGQDHLGKKVGPGRNLFSRMRSEEFLLLSGGLGGGPCCPDLAGADACVRAFSRMFAWLCHWDWWRRRCRVSLGGAVPLGLVGKALRGWRCAIGIGGQSVAWVVLCHRDWRGRRRMGGAVPLGLG